MAARAIKIERGAKLPALRHNRKYPFHQMMVGESFVVPSYCSVQSVKSAACQYGKRHGVKFVVRWCTKDFRTRCFRIE